MVAAVAGAVAACRTEGGDIPTTARIRLLAGETQVAPGVRVVAHRPDGGVIDEDDSDAVGARGRATKSKLIADIDLRQ